jgi:hypothetical protein
MRRAMVLPWAPTPNIAIFLRDNEKDAFVKNIVDKYIE